MAIYAGVEGITKEFNYVDASRHGTIRHLPIVKAGIDGVMRNLLDITSQVKCLEIDIKTIQTYTVDLNGNYESNDGYSFATAIKYGIVSITKDSIKVSNNTTMKAINLGYDINIVFSDNHKEPLKNLCDSNKNETTFSLSVYGYKSLNDRRNGYYSNNCMGIEIIEGCVTNIGDRTVTITNESCINSYGYIRAIRSRAGTTTTQQKFNSFLLNGVSFPITVVNNLKQKEDE